MRVADPGRAGRGLSGANRDKDLDRDWLLAIDLATVKQLSFKL